MNKLKTHGLNLCSKALNCVSFFKFYKSWKIQTYKLRWNNLKKSRQFFVVLVNDSPTIFQYGGLLIAWNAVGLSFVTFSKAFQPKTKGGFYISTISCEYLKPV